MNYLQPNGQPMTGQNWTKFKWDHTGSTSFQIKKESSKSVHPVKSYEYSSVKDNQFGMSNFNWKVGTSNYQILRTGCFPYIKYHCSKKQAEDLDVSDRFMRIIKVVNLGIPCLLYGLAATQLIRHTEVVYTSKGPVNIYFLLPEHKGSIH